MEFLQAWLPNEGLIRFLAFVAVFVALAAWEVMRPRRPSTIPRAQRWTGNLLLAFLGALAVRIFFPAAAVGIAIAAEAGSLGFMRHIPLGPVAAVVLGVVLLDLAIYLQHVLFHAIPLLWRFHRVHHADPDFDVSTAMRFHPVELLVSMGIKGLVILALGPPAVAVMIFEVLLNVGALFTHANIRLPGHLDRLLRWVVVTPDMHRIHHSVERRETNSNFGFNLTVWDRVFGSYRRTARLPAGHIVTGQADLADPAQTIRIAGLLKLPFGTPGPRD